MIKYSIEYIKECIHFLLNSLDDIYNRAENDEIRGKRFKDFYERQLDRSLREWVSHIKKEED